MAYDVGQQVRLSFTFRNLAGELADPTTVTVKVQDAAGAETSYSDAVHDSTGRYHKDITITTPGGGVWYYRAEGTGALVAAGETSFPVRQTVF